VGVKYPALKGRAFIAYRQSPPLNVPSFYKPQLYPDPVP